MKVLLLAAANSIHTVRWANGLASRGVDVHLVTAHNLTTELDPRVNLHVLAGRTPWVYVFGLPTLRQLIQKIKPDLINAHYATGYGLLAKLSGFKPYLLSVWGSDIYDFPEKSFFHRWVLRSNLKAATALASTSKSMAKETEKYVKNGPIFVTPFGVDERKFYPTNKPSSASLVIGTVKALKSHYGIDLLIYAFAAVRRKFPDEVRLEIAGAGPDLEKLKQLVVKLDLEDRVIFHGFVPHVDVPMFLNRMDIYVALSNSESFGVAIVEASACGLPVVVSNADGPAEVTIHEKTGIVVPKNDVNAAAEALLKLLRSEQLRSELGQAGRRHVLEKYTWDKSLDCMMDTYKKVISHS